MSLSLSSLPPPFWAVLPRFPSLHRPRKSVPIRVVLGREHLWLKTPGNLKLVHQTQCQDLHCRWTSFMVAPLREALQVGFPRGWQISPPGSRSHVLSSDRPSALKLPLQPLSSSQLGLEILLLLKCGMPTKSCFGIFWLWEGLRGFSSTLSHIVVTWPLGQGGSTQPKVHLHQERRKGKKGSSSSWKSGKEAGFHLWCPPCEIQPSPPIQLTMRRSYNRCPGQRESFLSRTCVIWF